MLHLFYSFLHSYFTFYSTALSPPLPLQPPPASTTAPAGGAAGSHLNGEHWDRHPQVSKHVFGKYTQIWHKLFRPIGGQHYSFLREQGFARNEDTLVIQTSFLDTHEHEQPLEVRCQRALVAVGPWAGVGWVGPSHPFTPLHCPNSCQGLPATVLRLCPHTQPAPLVAGPLTVLRCCLTDTISSRHDTTEQASEIPL